jgi:ABC-type glycerol-3-phosphate transport system substrate-binding protein
MRFPKTLLAVAAALAMTAVCAAASDAATKPADKAAPTKAAASELTVDLKVKGMT